MLYRVRSNCIIISAGLTVLLCRQRSGGDRAALRRDLDIRRAYARVRLYSASQAPVSRIRFRTDLWARRVDRPARVRRGANH